MGTRPTLESKVLVIDLTGRAATSAPRLARDVSVDEEKARIIDLDGYDEFLSKGSIPRYAAIGVLPVYRMSRGPENPFEHNGFDAMLFYPSKADLIDGRWPELDETIDGLYALITKR